MLKRRRILGSNLGGVRTTAGFGLYGDGSDGDVSISGAEVTLSRDMYYDNLTIQSDGILNANCYRIFVRNLLTVKSGGRVHSDGLPGLTDGSEPPAPSTGTIGTGGTGGAGGGPSSGIDDGSIGASTTSSIGGGGGAGGAGSVGAGGAFAFSGLPAASTGGPQQCAVFFGAMRGTLLTSYATRLRGGAGGSGGGSDSFNNAPSGGNGGNPLMIFAKFIKAFSGSIISSNGGDGGDFDGINQLGGGGGGGGGGIIIHTESPYASFSSATIQSDGGVGGEGDITDGQAGTGGLIYISTGDY